MRKRVANGSTGGEPPHKKPAGTPPGSGLELAAGDVLTDVFGKKWRIGKAIGVGAFGEVFLASDRVEEAVGDTCGYVAKIERHTNGPLFVEINCYLRVAKREAIEEWKKANNQPTLGMPYYIASGSHNHGDSKYRFLILPRYDTDLDNMLEKKSGKLHLKTVLTISLQLLDVLRYIHSKGFIHADIKASNILLEFAKDTKPVKVEEPRQTLIRLFGPPHRFRACRLATTAVVHKNLRSNGALRLINDVLGQKKTEVINCRVDSSHDQMYLLDYGLASKYLQSNGDHKKYCADRRRAHAGTLLFCSMDAHRGALSRRSDLESLGYNIIFWLTSKLPWDDDLGDPELVMKKKERCMAELEPFLIFCFGKYPKFLLEYFKYINGLDCTAEPDYERCKSLLRRGFRDCGCVHDRKFDFDKKLRPSFYRRKQTNSENIKCKKIAYVINRTPLKSNLPIKPVLRVKNKNKKLRMMKWSQILMDPETILKQAKVKERKLTESNDETQSLSNINIDGLNPTDAMMDVYNGYMERVRAADGLSPKYKCDGNTSPMEGYTSAMVNVHNKMMERIALEAAEKSTRKGRRHCQKPTRAGPKKPKGQPCKKTKPSVIRTCSQTRSRTSVRLCSLRG